MTEADPSIPLNHDALSELLNDPIMIRIVTVLNIASHSILELLEYGLTRQDVNRGLAKGVIEFDRPASSEKKDTITNVLESGDYYFGVLSGKVTLSKLGLYMLEIIEADTQQTRLPDIKDESSRMIPQI